MNFSVTVKKKLFEMIDEMDAYAWLFVQNPLKDFSREKKWSFGNTLKFMISMEGKSMRDELLEYFDFDKSTPTNSSFNQRRAQILPEAFEFLFREFSSYFCKKDACYKGFRLIACDGSSLDIAHNPADKTTYFQSSPDMKGFNQLHLNALYDLCQRTYVDAEIQPGRQKNEDSAMCHMVDRYNGGKAIFIADRNYESYNIFAHVEQRGMYYLIRVKDIKSSGMLRAMKLPDTESFDTDKTFILTRKQTNAVKAEKEKYRFIPTNSTFDYLDLHINKFYEINMRIVRFPISEDSYECIITNLPRNEFSCEEIKWLYQKRWGIETSFRELKHAIGLTRFHAKKVEYIKQEIWARMLLYNFCEVITTKVVVIQKPNRKHFYQVNYTRAIRICCFFLRTEKAPPDVEYLIKQELLPVRSGRSNPRKVRPTSHISFLYRAA